MPAFNWEINVGSLIAILTILGFFWKFYYGTENSNKQFADALLKIDANLDKAMTKIDKNMETTNKVITDIALSTQRQDNFEEATRQEFLRIRDDIKEMKHWKGFVNDPERVRG